MGSLGGHVLPGSFFLVFGIWSAWCILMKYFLCKKEKHLSGSREGKSSSSRYRNTLLFPCCFCKKIPLAPLLIMISTMIGIIGEVVTGFKNGHFVHIGNGQHISMYFFFGLMAMMNILEHYRFNVIPKLDYMAGVLALLMELVLFSYHLHGRSALDIQIHMFLVYLIMGAIIAALLEMVFVKSVGPAITRAFFIVLQGTWFWQVGFILYPPPGVTKWDEENHEQMMIATMIYTWHFAGVFAAFLVMGAAVNCRVKLLSRSNLYRALDIGKTANATANGISLNGRDGVSWDSQETTLNMLEDSEVDIL